MTDLERELAAHLNDVTRCLVDHLSQEAHDVNTSVEKLCPCWGKEVTAAQDLLERIRLS